LNTLKRKLLPSMLGLLAAPASTVIQPSPIHTGLSEDPPAELERLLIRLVG